MTRLTGKVIAGVIGFWPLVQQGSIWFSAGSRV